MKEQIEQKVKLVKGTRFVSFLFIGASILISAGIMQAANVYYDLDTQTIMTTEKQSMAGDVTVSSGNVLFSTTGTINQTGTGQVTFAGNVNATNGLDVTVADFTVGGGYGSSGVTISDAGAVSADSDISTKGKLGIVESVAGGSTNFTYFQGGSQTTDVTYTLPTGYSAVSGYVLSSTDTGVMSWVPASQGTVMDVGSQNDVTLAFGDASASGHWLGMGASSGRVAFDLNGAGTDYVNVLDANLGVGVTAPSAALTIKAGTATAGTAPLKFTAGTNLTTPETGAVEFNGDNLFITDDAATPERFKIADIDQDLMTAGRLCSYTASGHLDCTIDSGSVGHTALTLGNVDSYGSNNAAGMSLNGQVLNLRSADASNPGVINTGAQTIAGAKTFSSSTTLASTASAIFTIGNSTGAGTIASGGTSSWTNTSGNLTIGTATSGTLALSSAGALNMSSLGAMTFTFDEADGFSLKDDQGSPVTYFEIAVDGTMTLRTNADGDEVVLDPEGAGAGTVRVAAGDSLYVGDVPINGTGDGILVGQVNIFGFDYPTQCAASCDDVSYATVSRDIIALPNFPTLVAGKVRQYKLVIRYADDLTVDGNSTWKIWNTTTDAEAASFTVAGTAATGNLDKGKVFVTGALTIPTNGDDWNVRVNVPLIGDAIRVYSMDLAAYDVVD